MRVESVQVIIRREEIAVKGVKEQNYIQINKIIYYRMSRKQYTFQTCLVLSSSNRGSLNI